MTKPLPDYYATVADDILAWCQPARGVWVDLGAGAGALGLALVPHIVGTVMLVDPNREALMHALDAACQGNCHGHVVAVEGAAEQLPLPSSSVDYVVSRGSIFFWADQAQGLREVYRVLRPGGRAMIGGGLGSTYPVWARQEFIRRQRANGPQEDTPEAQEFRRLRHHDTFRAWAEEAAIPQYTITGDGGLPPDDPQAGVGIWLRFSKEDVHER